MLFKDPSFKNPKSQELLKKMVPRSQVVDYISSNLHSGYDLSSIRARLISSGYEPSEINAAIEFIKSGKDVHDSHSKGTFTLIAIIMVGFLFVAGVATVFFNQQNQSPLPNSPTTTFNPATSASTGSGAYGGASNSGQNTPSSATNTGGNNPGTGTALSPTTTRTTPLSGSGTGRNSIPSVDYSTPTENDQLATRLAIENKVNSLAASQPDQAATLCTQINTIAGQQSCLNTVAQISEQSRFCTQITDSDAADSCLISLALIHAEDNNLCKQIQSEIRFRQCILLYGTQSQADTLQKAVTQVQAAQPLAQQEQNQSQLEAPYTTDFDNAISNPATGQNISDQTNDTTVQNNNLGTDPNLTSTSDSSNQTVDNSTQ